MMNHFQISEKIRPFIVKWLEHILSKDPSSPTPCIEKTWLDYIGLDKDFPHFVIGRNWYATHYCYAGEYMVTWDCSYINTELWHLPVGAKHRSHYPVFLGWDDIFYPGSNIYFYKERNSSELVRRIMEKRDKVFVYKNKQSVIR